MMRFLVPLFICFVACGEHKELTHSSAKLKPVQIPFYFSLSDYQYQYYGPTLVQLRNEKGELVFEHKGKWNSWGMSGLEGELKWTGIYKIHVQFYEDSTGQKQTVINDQFDLAGDEESIDLVIQLDYQKQVTVNKYYGNQFGLTLKRIWDPEKQFTSANEKILPEYDIINTCDSTVYGIYHRFSSSLATSWIQLHGIAFLRYQHYVRGRWVDDLGCNAPRITMDLMPGRTGNTLKDIVNDCDKANFKKGDRYRIEFQYGVNNRFVAPRNVKDSIPAYYYIERRVYSIYDEFVPK